MIPGGDYVGREEESHDARLLASEMRVAHPYESDSTRLGILVPAIDFSIDE